jgi:hypothetical protein
LADRHTITPERAREAIDAQIDRNPAPARPAGRKAPTGRLSRWFSSTKAKLTKFIEKAWDYFNDAAVMSAGKGGWSPEEVRSAGMSGNLLDRTEAILAADAADQTRQQQEVQAAEIVRAAGQAERLADEVWEEEKLRATLPEKQPEQNLDIDLGLFEDDDEPSGPGLG